MKLTLFAYLFTVTPVLSFPAPFLRERPSTSREDPPPANNGSPPPAPASPPPAPVSQPYYAPNPYPNYGPVMQPQPPSKSGTNWGNVAMGAMGGATVMALALPLVEDMSKPQQPSYPQGGVAPQGGHA